MATVERSNIGNLHDQLSVKVSKEDYMPAFEKTLKSYGKTANIPGFRKGHVPTGMIKKMYGQSVFADEVIKTAYNEVEKYLQNEKPSIFAQPMVMPNKDLKLDMNQPGDFQFDFEMGIKPEFAIKPIEEKKSITKYKIKISDDMLDKEIEQLAKRAGNLEDQDKQTSDDDLIYLNYFSLNDAGEVENVEEPIEDVVEYGSLPSELKEKLIGTAKDFKFTFSPNDITDATEKEKFLKDALKISAENEAKTFNAEVTNVARLMPRALDEAFYKEVFPSSEIADETAFRAEVAKALEAQVERFSLERLQNDIYETMVHGTEMELPESFLKRWLKEGGETPKTDEEVTNEWSSFDHQLRWTLISDKLVEKYGIQVSYDEIMNDMKQRVMAYFGAQNEDDTPWLQSYLERMSKDQNTIEETHRRLLMDKLFGAIANELNITEQEVSDEEFANLPNEHHHH